MKGWKFQNSKKLFSHTQGKTSWNLQHLVLYSCWKLLSQNHLTLDSKHQELHGQGLFQLHFALSTKLKCNYVEITIFLCFCFLDLWWIPPVKEYLQFWTALIKSKNLKEIIKYVHVHVLFSHQWLGKPPWKATNWYKFFHTTFLTSEKKCPTSQNVCIWKFILEWISVRV